MTNDKFDAMTSRSAGVYEIRNLANGKAYIGSARIFASRCRTHRQQLKNGKHANQALLADWRQFGEASFAFVVLEEVMDRGLLEEREQFWIDQKQSTDPGKGYNLQTVAVRGRDQNQEYHVNLYKNRCGIWWIRFRLPPSVLAGRAVTDESLTGWHKPDTSGRIAHSLKTRDRREAFRRASNAQFLLYLATWDALTAEVGRAMQLAERREAEYHLNEARRTLDEQGFKMIQRLHDLLSEASEREWDRILKRASRNDGVGVSLHHPEKQWPGLGSDGKYVLGALTSSNRRT
jgi:group I intron endonuclease